MKRFSFLVLLLAFLAVGCAHRPSPVSSLPQLVMVASDSERIPLKSPEVSVTSGSGSADDKENLADEKEVGGGRSGNDCRPAGALQPGHVPLQRQTVLLGSQTRGAGI